MNGLTNLFRLTRNEQRVVIVLVLALLAIALFAKSRETVLRFRHALPASSVSPTAEAPD
jgi:hypothetical protein